MKKISIYFGIIVGITAVASEVADEWWNLWMCCGWPGPPGWQWLITVFNADGESAYDVVMMEMFLIIFFSMISTVIIIIRLLIRLAR
jgi:glucan phosphoethanolaminetransferase (alkaline phosphatase superfamily)